MRQFNLCEKVLDPVSLLVLHFYLLSYVIMLGRLSFKLLMRGLPNYQVLSTPSLLQIVFQIK